jgi:hypothetical protein
MKKMEDKRFVIKQMEYFSDYRDSNVFGMSPKEILEHKLFSLATIMTRQVLKYPKTYSIVLMN